jgi:hypothetical protein
MPGCEPNRRGTFGGHRPRNADPANSPSPAFAGARPRGETFPYLCHLRGSLMRKPRHLMRPWEPRPENHAHALQSEGHRRPVANDHRDAEARRKDADRAARLRERPPEQGRYDRRPHRLRPGGHRRRRSNDPRPNPRAHYQDNRCRDPKPPLSCTPLCFRDQRIKREGQPVSVHRHSTIIASTRPHGQARADRGSFRNTGPAERRSSRWLT